VSPEIAKLAMFLDALGDELPRTVVYSLNPYDDKLIDTVIGAFQRGRGYIQHGSAWWFNDTYYGIRSHLTTLCEYGALGTFIGMLTDSRSFSSYVRHDYFRRILSGVVAEEVDRGLFPRAAAEQVVRDVSYYNVKKYLGL
jgi:glucuronate isomerase